MSGVDIRELEKENLASGKFPVNPRTEFRLHMTDEVHQKIQNHAKADVSVEICGVLVGQWGQDDNGPYALISECIQCDSATSKFAEVTFTHESWSQINKEMDSKFSDLRIIGWYHSHPDFGIFLSERDVFIHENFFSGPGQVAYVVDPVRDLEGVFVWRDGKPAPLAHYWVGNRVKTVDASRRSPQQNSGSSQPARPENAAATASAPVQESSLLPIATTLLAWVAVFLLGYLLASWRTGWERQMIVRGAVAHYGLNKVMKFGLEDQLTSVQKLVAEIHAEFQKLPASNADLTKEERAEVAKKRQVLSRRLRETVQILEKLKQHYGLSDDEKKAVAVLIADKQAEMQGLKSQPDSKADAKADDTPKTEKTEPSSKTAAPKEDEPEKPPEKETDDEKSSSS